MPATAAAMYISLFFLVDCLPKEVPLKTRDDSAFADFLANPFVPDPEHWVLL